MRKQLVYITLACLVIGGLTFSIKCEAGTHFVTVNNTQFNVDTLEDDLLAYIRTNNPVFTDENLNEFVNYTTDLSVIENRSGFERFLDSLKNKSYQVNYEYSFNVDGIKDYITEYNKTATQSVNAYIDKDEDGFYIVSEVYGNTIDLDLLLDNLDYSFSTIDVSDYYIEPTIVASDLSNKLNSLGDYVNWSCTYTAGSIISSSLDYVSYDNGNIVLDSDWISEVISEATKSYNTVGIDRDFVNYYGDTITVSGGTWGSSVDEDSEVEYLISCFVKGESLTDRIPIYSYSREDIGDTYIEVSIDEQHVWVYKDGELLMDTDCVTGTCDNRHETPTGMYYICEYQNGRTLRPQGSTSGTWVNKWMRITWDGVGLHDAYWRSAFGGTIYKNNGSHGCINLPKSFAYDLFDIAYLGMPVIVY